MKKALLMSLILATFTLSLAAETLLNVAVVDTAKIMSVFFIQSGPWRDLEKTKQDVQAELDRYSADLRRLQEQRIQLFNQGKNTELLKLDQDIYNLQQFITEYRRVKQQQLSDMQRNLTKSDAFLNEVVSAIRFVAESEGFTLVLDLDNTMIRWWSAEIDITDKVLDRLKKTAVR